MRIFITIQLYIVTNESHRLRSSHDAVILFWSLLFKIGLVKEGGIVHAQKFGPTFEINEKDRRQTLEDLTHVCNEKLSYKRRVLKKKKVLVHEEWEEQKRVMWCNERRHLTVHERWCKFVFSDECQIISVLTNKIYDRRKYNENNNLSARWFR